MPSRTVHQSGSGGGWREETEEQQEHGDAVRRPPAIFATNEGITAVSVDAIPGASFPAGERSWVVGTILWYRLTAVKALLDPSGCTG